MSIAVCYCGPIDEGEQVLRPLRTFRSPVDDTIQPMPYTVLQSTRDEGFPSGRLHYWKSGWLRDVTDGAIETLMQFVPQMPSSASGVGLQQMHGVASRVAPSATAFPHRAEQYDFLIGSQWSDAERLGSQRPVDQGAVRGDGASPRGVGVREQPG